MSFYEYVKDKRYFLAVYALFMLFVALMMLITADRERGSGSILYTLAVCTLLAAAYVCIGYFHRRTFYRELRELVDSGPDEPAHALPVPQNAQQTHLLELIRKQHRMSAARLHKLMSEKKEHQEFIMSWIHEVKLPIAASRLLMENSPGKDVDFLIDKFEDELNKIDHYVEQAMFYSRIDSFANDYFITDVQLSALVRGSVKKYAKLFIAKRIRFELQGESQTVHSDSKWLAFIIDQLMTNSLKYTPDGGEIVVRLEEDAKERRLVIQDTGIGIKQEDIHRIFDKGFTGSNGRTQAKSTGMGLYLAKKLAHKLTHDVTVRSEEGRFTEMTVRFPKIRSGDYRRLIE